MRRPPAAEKTTGRKFRFLGVHSQLYIVSSSVHSFSPRFFRQSPELFVFFFVSSADG
jgi:hypothetical protein